MKTFARLAAGLCICAIASQANAWSQPTHKNIVKDALAFMNSSYATEEMRQAYRFYVSAAGSEAQAGEILGQAAFDVDDFKDTRLGAGGSATNTRRCGARLRASSTTPRTGTSSTWPGTATPMATPTAATTTATTRSTAASPTSTGTPWSISTTAS